MSGLTKLGIPVIPSSVKTKQITTAEQKSSATNEGYIIMCQDNVKSHIKTQDSKLEKTGQPTGQPKGSFARILQRAKNYVAAFGQSSQQSWFSGKAVARLATAFVFGIVVSGTMVFSNAADAQSVLKFSSTSATATEPESATPTTLVELNYTFDTDPASAVTITYETQVTGTGSGHAVAGEDFVAPSATDNTNTVTATTSDSIAITILPDDIDEPDETFKVVINSCYYWCNTFASIR